MTVPAVPCRQEPGAGTRPGPGSSAHRTPGHEPHPASGGRIGGVCRTAQWAPPVSRAAAPESSDIETVEIHHLGPGRHEVVNEFFA